jgi:hypothetical protein
MQAFATGWSKSKAPSPGIKFKSISADGSIWLLELRKNRNQADQCPLSVIHPRHTGLDASLRLSDLKFLVFCLSRKKNATSVSSSIDGPLRIRYGLTRQVLVLPQK